MQYRQKRKTQGTQNTSTTEQQTKVDNKTDSLKSPKVQNPRRSVQAIYVSTEWHALLECARFASSRSPRNLISQNLARGSGSVRQAYIPVNSPEQPSILVFRNPRVNSSRPSMKSGLLNLLGGGGESP